MIGVCFVRGVPRLCDAHCIKPASSGANRWPHWPIADGTMMKMCEAPK